MCYVTFFQKLPIYARWNIHQSNKEILNELKFFVLSELGQLIIHWNIQTRSQFRNLFRGEWVNGEIDIKRNSSSENEKKIDIEGALFHCGLLQWISFGFDRFVSLLIIATTSRVSPLTSLLAKQPLIDNFPQTSHNHQFRAAATRIRIYKGKSSWPLWWPLGSAVQWNIFKISAAAA